MRNGALSKSKVDKSYMENCLLCKQDLSEPRKLWGFTNVLRCCYYDYHDLFLDYMKYYASILTTERIKISTNAIMKKVFGVYTKNSIMPDLLKFKNELNPIIDKEYFNQRKVFVRDNIKEMTLDNEIWVLYWLKGAGLWSKTFNFSKIETPTIRKEVMLYFKSRLKYEDNYKNESYLFAVTSSLNFITKRNKNIKFCSDIEKDDVVALLHYLEYDTKSSLFKKNLSPSFIKKTIEHCRLIVRWLMEFSDEGHPLSYTLPQNNPFEELSFHNIPNLEHNTEIIPDLVFEQLEKYVHELNITYRLIHTTLKNTGMRIGEVIDLKEGCVNFIEEYDVWIIKYKITKNLKFRRKGSKQEDNILVIPENVAFQILEQEQISKDLRARYQIQNIFITEADTLNGGYRHASTNGGAFTFALNRLAKKHNIVDVDGNIWHFTSRQYRKKVAIDMIENNATLHELARQLGHNNTNTGRRYYAQIRKARLADLNHKFFEKKFGLIMGEDTLKAFNEEERKALYVDFCLDSREVELGVCTKHFSAEPCGKRTGKGNCASCKNICTGLKYLDKWVLLRDSKKKILDELIRLYETEGIDDYTNYREYQRELYWYDVYNDAVNKINKWKESQYNGI